MAIHKFTMAVSRRPGLYLSLAYCVSVIVLALTLFYLEGFQQDGRTFLMSFAASLSEDLIFFLFIGIVLFIVTLKKPEDDKIDVRLSTVVSNKKVTRGAKEYFQSETRDTLAYYSRYDVTIVLSAYDHDEEAYKLTSHVEGKIVNMCDDTQFKGNAKVFVSPDKFVHSEYGELSMFSIYDGSEVASHNSDTTLSVPMTSRHAIDKDLDFIIPPDGELYYRFSFSIWSGAQDQNPPEDDAPFYTAVDRFAEEYNLRVINKLPDLRIPFIAEQERHLTVGSRKIDRAEIIEGYIEPNDGSITVLPGVNLSPKETIYLSFGRPESPHNSHPDEEE